MEVPMQALINELNQLCTKYHFTEKIVVVDSHAIGEQINEAFIKEGHQAINLKYKTVFDLAQNVVELNMNQPLNILDHTVGVHLTYTLLKELKLDNRLLYFAGMEITPSFSHSIYSTIQTLRLAGYRKETLNRNAFITTDKAEDLAEILSEYEKALGSYGFIDKAELLSRAIEFAQVDEKRVFILQSNLNLTYLEEQLIRKIIPESIYKLPLAPVFGVNTPEKTSIGSVHWGSPTPLSYLYQQSEASGTPNINIFTAKTLEMEI